MFCDTEVDLPLKSVGSDTNSKDENKTELVVTDVSPSLSYLWSYTCSITRGRNVSSIGWNATNPVCTADSFEIFTV